MKLDTIEISLTSYEGMNYITFEKIDTEKGKALNYKLNVKESELNEIAEKFDLDIDTLPF